MKRTRRLGFTLLELMISMSILLAAFVILIPQFNKMRSVQMCNNAAQELAADFRRMGIEALHTESYMALITTAAGTGYTVYQIPQSYSNVKSSWQIFRTKDYSTDYGRVILTAGANTSLYFGPKGWPALSTDVNFPNVATLVTDTSTPSKGQYYAFTCSAGTGVQSFTVQVYTNGRVNVVSP